MGLVVGELGRCCQYFVVTFAGHFAVSAVTPVLVAFPWWAGQLAVVVLLPGAVSFPVLAGLVSSSAASAASSARYSVLGLVVMAVAAVVTTVLVGSPLVGLFLA